MRALSAPVESAEARDILRKADALGIPWQRILSEEIRAERLLRMSLADVEGDWPLWPILRILPLSLLNSWRVRERIQSLAFESRRNGNDEPARELRALYAHLSGRRNGRPSDATRMRAHFWFAYQRVLALVRIARRVERVGGDPERGLDALCERDGTSPEDARWAFERLSVRPRRCCLDDAMRRVRDEGFEVPGAESEVRAFRRLRSLARARD